MKYLLFATALLYTFSSLAHESSSRNCTATCAAAIESSITDENYILGTLLVSGNVDDMISDCRSFAADFEVPVSIGLSHNQVAKPILYSNLDFQVRSNQYPRNENGIQFIVEEGSFSLPSSVKATAENSCSNNLLD